MAQLINDRFDQQNSNRKHLLVINVSGKRSPLYTLTGLAAAAAVLHFCRTGSSSSSSTARTQEYIYLLSRLFLSSIRLFIDLPSPVGNRVIRSATPVYLVAVQESR